MSEIRKGDRYRIIIEGEWNGRYATNATGIAKMILEDDFITDDTDFITVEKIEPPAEPFEPGDFVREIPTDRIFYVAENGYAQVKPTAGQFWKFGEAGVDGSLPSTTGEYEKVGYAEVPF